MFLFEMQNCRSQRWHYIPLRACWALSAIIPKSHTVVVNHTVPALPLLPPFMHHFISMEPNITMVLALYWTKVLNWNWAEAWRWLYRTWWSWGEGTGVILSWGRWTWSCIKKRWQSWQVVKLSRWKRRQSGGARYTGHDTVLVCRLVWCTLQFKVAA